MSLENRLKVIMSNILNVSISEIDYNTSMDNIDAWDSLKHMSLIISIEREFGVDLEDDDIEVMTSYEVIETILRDRFSV